MIYLTKWGGIFFMYFRLAILLSINVAKVHDFVIPSISQSQIDMVR